MRRDTRNRNEPARQLALFPTDSSINLKSFFENRFRMEVEVAFRPGERRVSLRRSGHKARLEIHPVFQEARTVHLNAVADMLENKDAFSGEIVDAFLHQKRGRIRQHYPVTKRVTLYPYGRVHNLAEIFNELNDEYFGGEVRAYITWGRRTKTDRKRWSIRFGSYDRSTGIIRVHPRLDSIDVPRFFVEYIAYHEMLHEVVPEEIDDGRRIVHTREFNRRERDFKKYAKAIAWERANTRALLRRAVPT